MQRLVAVRICQDVLRRAEVLGLFGKDVHRALNSMIA